MYLDKTITHQNGPTQKKMAAEGPGCLHQAATRIFLVVPERPTREQEAAGRGTGRRRLRAGATPLAKLLWIGWAKGSKGHPRLRAATQSWRKNPQNLRGLTCDPFGPCGRNADVISGTNCCPLDITMRARSMAFLAPSLVMILARWHSIVRGLIPTFRAASLFDAAVMSSVRTAASRRQRVTAGKPCRPEFCIAFSRVKARPSTDNLANALRDGSAGERLFYEIEGPVFIASTAAGTPAMPNMTMKGAA